MTTDCVLRIHTSHINELKSFKFIKYHITEIPIQLLRRCFDVKYKSCHSNKFSCHIFIIPPKPKIVYSVYGVPKWNESNLRIHLVLIVYTQHSFTYKNLIELIIKWDWRWLKQSKVISTMNQHLLDFHFSIEFTLFINVVRHKCHLNVFDYYGFLGICFYVGKMRKTDNKKKCVFSE